MPTPGARQEPYEDPTPNPQGWADPQQIWLDGLHLPSGHLQNGPATPKEVAKPDLQNLDRSIGLGNMANRQQDLMYQAANQDPRTTRSKSDV